MAEFDILAFQKSIECGYIQFILNGNKLLLRDGEITKGRYKYNRRMIRSKRLKAPKSKKRF